MTEKAQRFQQKIPDSETEKQAGDEETPSEQTLEGAASLGEGVREDGQEPPRFKFRDRRFWVDEDDEEEGDDEAAVSDKPTYVQQLEARVESAEKKLAEYVKAYKEEVQVEWERTKERIAREAQKTLEIERRKIVGSLLEVLDMLDMSLDSVRQGGEVDSLLQGLLMVRAEFEKKLMAHGLETVEAEDQVFDPKVHEAFAVEDLEEAEKEKDGKITAVFKAGYLLGGELVRPAMVRVGRYKKS